MKTLKRRRKENKTDYGKRIEMLKGGIPRLVFRKTNRYLIVEYVESKEAQDRAIITVNSKILVKYGWPKESKSIKSLPASYLLGILIGNKIIAGKLKTPIIDFGMHINTKKNKLFAFIRGLVDAGIKIKCDTKNFPDSERIMGRHLKNKIEFEKIKSSVAKK